MKIVILAGGSGTRLSEETGLKPKPMVEIGGMPILWHKGYHENEPTGGYGSLFQQQGLFRISSIFF